MECLKLLIVVSILHDVKVISEETGGYYSCRYGNCTVDRLLNVSDVKIDKRSIHSKNGTEVPEMKCRVNDLYNMTCAWAVDGVSTWTAMYKSREMDTYKCCTADKYENCTSSRSRRQCIVPYTDFYRFSPYNITLTEISELGTHFYHYTVVPDNTIASVNIDDNVRVKAGETPYKLVVGFTLHHPPIAVGGMKCDISYESNQEHAIVGNSTHNMCQTSLDVNITLDKLSPFTLYTVNISCKSQFSHYWSNHVVGSGRTKPLEPTAAKKINKGKTIAIATSCSVVVCLFTFIIISFFRKRIRGMIKDNTLSDEIINRILEDFPDNIPTQSDICSESSETSGIYSNSSSLTDDQTNAKSLESQQVKNNEVFELSTPQMEMHLAVHTSDLSRSIPDDYLIPVTISKNDLDEGKGLFVTGNEIETGQISTELSVATDDGNLQKFDHMRDESQGRFGRENVETARDITANFGNPCNDSVENASCHLACDSNDLQVGEYNKAVCLLTINSATLSSNRYLEAQPHTTFSSIPSTWHTFDTDDGHSGSSNSQFNDYVDVLRSNAFLGQTISSCDAYMNPGGDEDVDSNLTSITEYQRAEASQISRIFRTDFSIPGDMHANNSEQLFTSDFDSLNVTTSGATAYIESLDEYHRADMSEVSAIFTTH